MEKVDVRMIPGWSISEKPFRSLPCSYLLLPEDTQYYLLIIAYRLRKPCGLVPSVYP